MNRAALEGPFPDIMIKTRPGPSGKMLSYVEGFEYIRRLNEAFDGQWSFEVKEYKIGEKSVVVLGRIVAEGIAKEAFGGSSITRDYQTGEATNIADDLKAAATDALKKASSLLGLGLHLYSASQQPSSAPRREDDRGSPPPREGRHGEKAPLSGNGMTQRQFSAIEAIARSLGWSRDDLRERCVDMFDCDAAELSKADASSMINHLQEQAQG